MVKAQALRRSLSGRRKRRQNAKIQELQWIVQHASIAARSAGAEVAHGSMSVLVRSYLSYLSEEHSVTVN